MRKAMELIRNLNRCRPKMDLPKDSYRAALSHGIEFEANGGGGGSVPPWC